ARPMTSEWLARQHVPAGAARVLFKTRNSALWADPNHPYTRDIVAVGASAARWLVERSVRLVGIDYLTIEPQGPEKAGYPTHHALLGAGVVTIQGLELGGALARGCELCCPPLKTRGG